MKKKITLFTVLLSLLLLSCFAFTAVGVFAEPEDGANGANTEFSKEITAITPKNGEKVSLANKYIETLFSSFNGEYSSVSKLLNITDEMATFTSVLGDADAVRALYRKWDDFKPVNNVLKWKFDGNAENYSVVVSRDGDLSTYVFKATTEETEVSLDNILYPDGTYFWQVSANLSGGESVVSEIFAFTTEDTVRTIDIDGVSNTRDIGGFDTPYGKTLNGLVYRSARLDDITEKGIEQMDALGIKSDVDLRALNEGRENPSGRENNYKYLNGPMYLQIFDDGFKDNLKAIVSLFADSDNYPVIFHCSVGRDRTGTLSFILNNLLGVAKNQIICEYMTSFLSESGALSVSKETDDLLQAVYGMYLVLDGYEGADYAEKTANFLLSIGITQDEIDAIRDIMTGKTEILAQDAENAEGYQGKYFVSFSCFGKVEKTFAVDSDAVISAPYDLNEGYVWTVNGEVADFSRPITDNVRFVAEKAEGFTVAVIVGGEKTETFYLKGAAVDLTRFEKVGYNCVVINEAGDIITSLSGEKDTTLSIIYIKK
ncbi:MAG: tyrosine-protein phosphatase [Clostridia bacterium]|nr:tyrosine-protein phosphatase [Clostridia bacterium]